MDTRTIGNNLWARTAAVLILLGGGLLCAGTASAAPFLAGRILLQVESRGEAWYVHPTNGARYSLGKPDDAYEVMRGQGLGINNVNLSKIPVGMARWGSVDTDSDGFPDALEGALGTDPTKADTDGDGYDDKTESVGGYNPLGAGRAAIDANFAAKQKGKILLQVESRGEAWYVNPVDGKRYYMGRAADALAIMRGLALGIRNTDLNKIPIANSVAVSLPKVVYNVEGKLYVSKADGADNRLIADFSAPESARLVNVLLAQRAGVVLVTDYGPKADSQWSGQLLDVEQLYLISIATGQRTDIKLPTLNTDSSIHIIYFITPNGGHVVREQYHKNYGEIISFDVYSVNNKTWKPLYTMSTTVSTVSDLVMVDDTKLYLFTHPRRNEDPELGSNDATVSSVDLNTSALATVAREGEICKDSNLVITSLVMPIRGNERSFLAVCRVEDYWPEAVRLYNLDTKSAVELARGTSENDQLTGLEKLGFLLSPNGKNFIYSRSTSRQEGGVTYLNGDGVTLVDIGSGKQTLLPFESGTVDLHGIWGPDSTTIVVYPYRDEEETASGNEETDFSTYNLVTKQQKKIVTIVGDFDKKFSFLGWLR